jgi:1-deoxy-D-xylulose-5-phosphate synthase
MKNNLADYDFPAELNTLTLKELELLAALIRDFLIENVSKTGGHLASNLGVVELSIALHKVFSSPDDKIIWDVGHQCYVHKILTGRLSGFESLRRMGGMSGFPKREESPHDHFDTGHSSNAVSAAMGFAAARDIRADRNEVVAVVGDGALTGGQAFEGLNNVGAKNTKLIVVLNDNEMSISKNIGSISQHISRLRTSAKYVEFKKRLKKALNDIPGIGGGLYSGMEHIRDVVKYMTFHTGAIFESLGFKYFGPVDGHNVGDLTEALSIAKLIDQPVFIHVLTVKGKGYKNAEMNPDRFHGIGPFEPTTGATLTKDDGIGAVPLGKLLLRMAAEDERLVAVTAAMTDGTGLKDFAAAMPKRFFDVGIAEAHAVTFAAGLACSGFKPYVAVYSTFLQRAYDQIAEEVCLQKLPVTFCVGRAGVTGADGETHQGVFDIAYLRHLPNMTVATPSCSYELAAMLEFSRNFEKPMAIRYPRTWDKEFENALGNNIGMTAPISIGKSVRIFEGRDVDIWAVGSMAVTAMAIRDILKEQGVEAGVVLPRFVKPFDGEALSASAKRVGFVVTLEDHAVSGGFGEVVAAYLMREGISGAMIKNFGWPDSFIEHGGVMDLRKKYGLDAKSIADDITAVIKRQKAVGRRFY